MRCRWLVFIALLVSACSTPREQPYILNPPAQERAIGKDVLVTVDGVELPLKRWLPSGRPKAAIIALHGFNDYSHAFEGTGTFFRRQGVAVYAYDQRGFGRSPNTGIWGTEENLTRDLAECVKQVSKRWPGVPVYVLGESMGGTVVVAALGDPGFPKVQGVILSAPALWGAQTMNPLYRVPLWLVAHTTPGMKFTGRDLQILASNNIPMLKALAADPLFIKETRADAIYGMVRLMDSAYDKVPAIAAPVLMLYGAKDEVIPKSSIEKAKGRFSAPMHYVYYPEGYHLLLRDLQGEDVMKDILAWVKQQPAAR